MDNKKTNKMVNTIAFNSADDKQHCYETNGANVIVQVQPRSNNSHHGSSMVKLKNIIGYKWETKNYPGHLIAVHKDGKIIAYSINVSGQGMVRLIHFGMGNKRALIKGMSKEVLDLQFADYSKDVIIGCIEESALHVHKMEVVGDSLNCVQLLKIESSIPDHIPRMDRISWCPYVPEDDTEIDEFSVMLLVWVRGTNFECYSVKTILDKYQPGVHKAESIVDGLLKGYDETSGVTNNSLITSAKFSPDGTTLAISTADGFIRFYQIYFHESTGLTPRCLHSWSPHDGAAISDFFFLDNHTQPIGDNTLWKYAVTLAANNTEIKVSRCENWETLQTISFKSSSGEPLAFKAEIDRTSSYLILSDMSNRQMYVLQILKENALSQNGSDDHHNGTDHSATGGISRVFVKSIAEFHLASPILSYGISNASIRRYKCALSDNYLIDELEDYDEENNSLYCVVLRLFMILPESVQECHILYQPALNESAEILSTEMSAKKSSVQLLNVSSTSSVESKISDLVIKTPPQKTSQLNLLTPDSFSSPIEKTKADVSQEVLSTIFMLANQASPGTVNKSHENVLNLSNCALIEGEEKLLQQKIPSEPIPIPIAIPIKSNASGGSSPSREVRDIMLKADSVNEDYYPGDDDELEELEGPEIVKDILNVLKSPAKVFKNIDDEDDEDDGNEEDDEDDDYKLMEAKGIWPQAPQFIEPGSAPATSKQIDTLATRMNQMIEIMEQQSRYIAELRNEIYSFKGQSSAETMLMQKNISSVDENCKQLIDQNHLKYENILIDRDTQNRNTLETIMQTFQLLSHNQVKSIENSIKENLMKVCCHQTFIDNVSQSMLMGIQKSLEATFKRALEEIMIPSYEKITHEMFQEMGKAFTAGTKEYTRAFDTYMKQYGAVQFQITEFSGAIHQIPQHVKRTNEQSIIPIMTEAFQEIKQRLDKFQMKIIHDVKEQVKSEIQNGFERQTLTLEDSVLSAVARSQAETPAPAVIDKDTIKQYIQDGDINKAFHQALISNDLSLVEFTIERADPNVVFNPCRLEQNVLMSLIQQLTADMSGYNELKNRYLSDAIIALQMNNELTKEHAPKILRELIHTFQNYFATHPNNPLVSSMKMILFGAQSYIKM